MAKLGQHRFSVNATTPTDGAGAPGAKPTERYCALCGQPAAPRAPAIERFGEAFCSEAHAQEFVQAVRAARVQTAAGAQTAVERSTGPAEATPQPRDSKASLGKALCWGAPLLVIAVVLIGGTGALAGAVGAVLPFLALLACPLGMYFMMRAMSKTGDHGGSKDRPGGR
jgi:hypothetical protein